MAVLSIDLAPRSDSAGCGQSYLVVILELYLYCTVVLFVFNSNRGVLA